VLVLTNINWSSRIAIPIPYNIVKNTTINKSIYISRKHVVIVTEQLRLMARTVTLIAVVLES